mgnify:CR=1 FL=1
MTGAIPCVAGHGTVSNVENLPQGIVCYLQVVVELFLP